MKEGAWNRRRAWVRRAAAVVLAGVVAGCAIPFGDDPDPGRAERTPRERNLLYREELERIERERQSFEPVRPSER